MEIGEGELIRGSSVQLLFYVITERGSLFLGEHRRELVSISSCGLYFWCDYSVLCKSKNSTYDSN